MSRDGDGRSDRDLGELTVITVIIVEFETVTSFVINLRLSVHRPIEIGLSIDLSSNFH